MCQQQIPPSFDAFLTHGLEIHSSDLATLRLPNDIDELEPDFESDSEFDSDSDTDSDSEPDGQTTTLSQRINTILTQSPPSEDQSVNLIILSVLIARAEERLKILQWESDEYKRLRREQDIEEAQKSEDEMEEDGDEEEQARNRETFGDDEGEGEGFQKGRFERGHYVHARGEERKDEGEEDDDDDSNDDSNDEDGNEGGIQIPIPCPPPFHCPSSLHINPSMHQSSTGHADNITTTTATTTTTFIDTHEIEDKVADINQLRGYIRQVRLDLGCQE